MGTQYISNINTIYDLKYPCFLTIAPMFNANKSASISVICIKWVMLPKLQETHLLIIKEAITNWLIGLGKQKSEEDFFSACSVYQFTIVIHKDRHQLSYTNKTQQLQIRVNFRATVMLLQCYMVSRVRNMETAWSTCKGIHLTLTKVGAPCIEIRDNLQR